MVGGITLGSVAGMARFFGDLFTLGSIGGCAGGGNMAVKSRGWRGGVLV